MPRGRKLYYDVALTVGGPSFRAAPTLEADRDGALLDTLPALDGNADAGARERQDLTALFVPYHWSAPLPPPPAFIMTNTAPPDGPYTGYLTMIFSGPVDPSSVNLGTSIVNSTNTSGYSGVSVEVVANEIRVHNTEGAGDEWLLGGMFVMDLFTTILELGTGQPLASEFSATWFF